MAVLEGTFDLNYSICLLVIFRNLCKKILAFVSNIWTILSREKKIYTLLLRIMFLILFSLNRIRSDSFARPLQFLQTSLCWKRHFTLVSFIFGRVFHSMHPRGGERRRTWKEEFGQLLTLVHTPVVVNIRLHGV